MRLKRFFWIAPTTVILIVSQTFRLNFLVPLTVSPVVAQTSDTRQVEADRLLIQGIEQFNTGQVDAALQSFQAALSIYREIKFRQGEGGALNNLGLAYAQLGDYTKAIKYHQQSMTIAHSMDDLRSEAQALNNLGLAYQNMGNYTKAIEHQQQSLVIAREIKDRETEAKVLNNLGNVYLYLGDYATATDHFQQSLVIARERKDRQGEGKVLNNLGLVYLLSGDYVKAIAHFEQNLAIAREFKDRLEESNVLGNLGAAYRDLGDYATAIEYQQQSLVIAQEIKDRQGEGAALGSLGLVYLDSGNYAKAIEYFEQHLSIARAIGDRRSEGSELRSLGIVYALLGDDAKAIEYFEQHLSIARAIGDRQGEGEALGNLGAAYNDLGDYAKAIEYHKQLLLISRELRHPQGEATALNNLGFALFKQGNIAAAESLLIESMKVKESLRSRDLDDSNKVFFFDTQRSTYIFLQQVLIAQNKTDAALEIAERGRARAFVELLTSRLSLNLKEQLPITLPNIEQIKKIAQQQNAIIVEYSIFNFMDEGKNPGKSALYIWVIAPNGTITFRQVDLKSLGTGATIGGSPLRKIVTQTLESLGVGEDRNGIFEVSVTNPVADPERQTKSLKQLHQLLIQPIADLLPSDPNSHVIFIPHQDLFRVPFPALIDSEGKYLVEKHTILTAPSIQVLELTQQQRQKVSRSGQGALVVGNPSPMPTGFPPLKGAEKEANDVAQLLKTKPLIGSQATEPAVLQQLPNARIIHLATHGTFNEQQPLLGGVALAQTGKDTQNDGLLTAEEIFNLKRKLTAELLVLSACNTGRGRITGDGVIGLSRSFIAAGIPSVIVSLWSVPDAPTAELMTQFYTNLYQKKLDKAQALRMAMLKIMEKYRDNPRAWAAFTLIGEAE